MSACKWMNDGICVNAECPMVEDYCPVPDYEDVSKYENRPDGG